MTTERKLESERKPYIKRTGPRPEEKKINIEQVVIYLNHAFSRAMQKVSNQIGNRNHKGTTLYAFQTEFCYLINEIQQGAVYILPKIIQDANNLIASLEKETNPYIEKQSGN
jgi:hypothetical protein